MKKRIVLCADDYGQAPAISQGIINLIQYGRLSATSCMVNTACWRTHAAWLLPYLDKVDVGLHFNLTEGKALSSAFRQAYGEDFQSLPQVLGKALLRQLKQEVIEAECHAQIDQFEAALGCLPRFLDGHQHVHQFPVIREAVIKVYKQRLRKSNAYVRWVNDPIKPRDFLLEPKKVIIYLTGTKSFNSLLLKNNIPFNSSFSGIYHFQDAAQYPAFFKRFLQTVKGDGMIMCHPGLPGAPKDDVIAESRWKEYQYLAGEQFLADCTSAEVVIGRFRVA